MEGSGGRKNEKEGLLYAFKQQIMRAWQPVPTIKSTINIFYILCNLLSEYYAYSP